MTKRHKSTYGAFHSLLIIISDFLSIISFEGTIKSGQKLYSVEKKKTTQLKNPLGRIYIYIYNFLIKFPFGLSEQNENNSDLLLRRPLAMMYAPVAAGARLQPSTRLRQRKQLVYPEQLLREQPAFYDIMVGLGGNRLTCSNARRRPAAWKITVITQSLLSKHAYNNRTFKPTHTTMKTIAFSTNPLWSPGINIKVNYCFFF